MTGPQDPAAAGRGRMRASHADRDQAIEALKAAFVQDRLTHDELDARAGRVLASRTYAELAVLTADIPAAPFPPATAGGARPPAPARHRPLARAAAKSGICLIIAVAATWAASILDPGGSGPNPYSSWGGAMVALAACAVLAALGIMGYAVFTVWDERSSRGQLPPWPGPGGQGLEAGQTSGTGHGPVSPGPRTDQTHADMRSDSSRLSRPHSSGRGARTSLGIRPVPDAV